MARASSEIWGSVGSGGQARAHYRFMTSVLPIKKVKVFSPDPEHREAFIDEMAKRDGVPDRTRPAVQQNAVKGCDVICSATNSSRPVLKRRWLKPG